MCCIVPATSMIPMGPRTSSFCIAVVRAALPGVSIEVRMDSAFFSDEIVGSLDAAGVEYTVSVPFERFTDLKARIEARRF